MKHNYSHQNNSGHTFLAFIAGAATAAAVGGYLLYGPHGEKNRKRLDRWMARARVEILDKMQSLQDITEDQYHNIVEEVTSRYGRIKEIGHEKAQRASEKFKNRWEEMREAAERAREEAEIELAEEESRRSEG